MAKKRKHKTDLAEQIRQAIADSGLSAYRVATDAGIDRSIMVRFLTHERGLTLTTASRICEVLGLDLRPVKRKKR